MAFGAPEIAIDVAYLHGFAVEVDAGTPDACRDKSFQPKIVEVNNKENDEIGVGVIAVAVDGFVSERLPVVPHFLHDGRKRSIEFVVLDVLGSYQMVVRER